MAKDSAPGKWCSFVPSRGHGEDYLQAAVRELREEIGLNLSGPLEPVFKESACAETGHEFVWVYRCVAEGPFTLDPEEISAGKWLELDALKCWMEQRPRDFAWSFVHLWTKYSAR